MKIGAKLKFLRTQQNISQSVIADILGITFQAYSLYENDLREPTFSTLEKICRYYNVSTDFLFLDEFNEDAIFVQLCLNRIKSKTVKLIKELAIMSKYDSEMSQEQIFKRGVMIEHIYEDLKHEKEQLERELAALGISEDNIEKYIF